MEKELNQDEIKILLDLICRNKSETEYASDNDDEGIIKRTIWTIDSKNLPVNAKIEVKNNLETAN